ncbi:RHS repeat-associated core domain-containing protein [Fulvimonas sp. R45]|uniref:RHS repeat-associated core domain-containing protein n=1 Tax=Fulvimonas sp. R45 TaxID=3045937 RepID=UPI00265D6AD3|nr:RHS repeat-associated core domain-containing protein [Fulvimonas sp. R45]MDO1530470.1 RHS repeat-associated core domain-containing protein [Fulvimonas sp. R45]
MVGNPINVGTGDKAQSATDFDLGDLVFTRYYNSSPSVRGSHLGVGWLDSYDRTVMQTVPGVATQMTAARPDGRELVFNKVGGVWVPDGDIPDRLVENDTSSGAVASWRLFVARTRTYESYSAGGLLLSISDGSHVLATLGYTAGTELSSTGSVVSPALLATVTDSQGRTLTFGYDNWNRLVSLRLPDGGSIDYGYDANNFLSQVTYPDHASRQYVYDEPAFSAAGVKQGKLTGIVDESGARYATYGYQADGRAISTQHGQGADRHMVSYATDGMSAQVTYPTGVQETLGFSNTLGSMKAAAASTPCGRACGELAQSRTYDANGYPASSTDFNGNVTTTTYDTAGLLTQQVDASGTPSQRTTNLTWDTTLRVPLTRTVLDASGHTVSNTQWTYNTRGQVLARCEVDPGNSATAGYACAATGAVPAGVRRWTTTYCDAVDGTQCPLVGLPLTATGPRTDLAQTTAYSYYLDSATRDCTTPGGACHQPGDLHTVTDALGHATTIASYDADGRITRETDANGVNTDLTYTPRGWLATRSVGGATTTFTYTPYGAVASITDPDGIVTAYTYDAAHRLTDITDAQGNRLHYTLDAAGNKTAEQVYDANGAVRRSLTRTYNPLGELTSVVDGLNQTVFSAGYSDSYDADGHLVHSANGRGVQQHQGYDALNRLVQTIQDYDGTDSSTANTTTGYAYDSLGRLTGVTDPDGLATTYAYDGLSDATGQASPDTGSTTRTYDAAGNVRTRTDAKGITATNSYDALDRLVSTTYPDSTQDVAYHYDEVDSVTGCSNSYPVGRLTRIVESAVTTVYCYDAQGRVTRKQQVTASGTDTTGYAYTAAGRLGGIVYPSGTLVTYTRDSDGRIQGVSVTPPNGTARTTVSSVAYLPFGPVSGYTLGNGQVVTRAYDANYRLTDLTSPAFNLHVARDAMGDITAIGNSPGASPATESYHYDALDRLTAITEADGSMLESVTYNKTGDRLSKSGSGLATGNYSYAANTHQLIATGNAARAVDANGNTTAISQAGITYGLGYNDRNRLTVVQSGGSTVGTYTYNALGQRIQKVTGTGTERLDYDEASQLLAEAGLTNRDYIWMDDIPVATVDTQARASTISYITADQLGTPRAIADGSGTAFWQLPYQGNAFEELLPASSTGYVYNLRSAGEYYDTETGLDSNGYRTRDPGTWRFLQSDPLGLGGGVSTYATVGSNPLGNIDPLGLQTLPPSTYSIDWTKPETRSAFAQYALNLVVPGYALYGCYKEGCGAAGWVGAALGSLPAIGAVSGVLREARAARAMCGAAEGSGKTIVIGESMADRVIPAAEANGASYYNPPEAPPEQWMQNNRDWINQKMDEGCTILDCGAAPGRTNYPNPTSPYYQMELDQIMSRGYRNYSKIPVIGE